MPSRFAFRANAASQKKSIAPPRKKPSVSTAEGEKPSSAHISAAGISRDQKDAAVITPAESPSIQSITHLFGLLKRKTAAAPAAVITHIKREAASACHTGASEQNKSNIITSVNTLSLTEYARGAAM
jgi:hypothetical protein